MDNQPQERESVMFGRIGGLKGAASRTPEERSAAARHAALALHAKRRLQKEAEAAKASIPTTKE